MSERASRFVSRQLRSAIDSSLARAVDSALDPRLAEIDASLRALRVLLQALPILQNASGRLSDSLAMLETETAALRRDVTWLRGKVAELQDGIAETRQIAGGVLDRIPELRSQLLHVRSLPDYSAAFDEKEPLITVRMATFNRADLLLERSIPSVLAQTYGNFELVVVGDGCTDDTAERIAQLGDPRVRFVNLPHHGIYPTDPARRWMVAGGRAMNLGAELARGRWVAHLDDDDEFSPEHLAVLVEAARAGRYEMVCSRFASTAAYHAPVLGRYPPQLGQFSFVSALYMAQLRFFEFDAHSWMLGEPHDWNLCRRMMEAGVRIGWVDQVLTTIYPTGPRRDDGPG